MPEIKFIYWRRGKEQDGIVPFDNSIYDAIETLYKKRLITQFVTFPVSFTYMDLTSGEGYSITDYA